MSRKWITIIISLFAVILLIAACGVANNSSPDAYLESEMDYAQAMPTHAPTQAAMQTGQRTTNVLVQDGDMQQQPPAELQAEPQRVILKNATLTITVDDPEIKIESISQLAQSMSGWVVTSQVNSSQNNSTSGNITVRIPAQRLEEALAQIKTDVHRVDHESITGQDVTSEYVDLSSRLDNLRTSKDQLQAIMSDATTVEEVLAVQAQLTSVSGDIEVIEGRLQYFDQASAFSSVQVTVRETPPEPVTYEYRWNPGHTVEEAFEGLIELLQFLIDGLITFAIMFLPFVLAIGFPAWWIWRRWRRRHILKNDHLDQQH